MKDEKIRWLKEYFASKKALPDHPELEKENYFQLGLIDSMGVLELIEAAEAQFSIQFQQTNFTDRRFATIAGLADIIDELEANTHGAL